MTFEIAGTILTGRTLGTGAVTVTHDGRIGAEPGGTPRTVRLPAGWIAAPGFVDVQVNGYAGAEVGDDPVQLAAVAAALPRTGVTAFCPTLVTRSPAGYRRAAATLAAVRWPDAGARPLGVHLEGPFLNPVRAGAHRPAHMTTPGAARVAALLRLLRPAIVTLAPELPDAESAIAQIAAAGAVPAVGHTEADAATALRAIAAGARLLTHAFNAMRGIDSRRPSALAAFLAHAAAHVSLIGDGAHVAPEVAALTARAAGRRLVLVSDASPPAGTPPGTAQLGGVPVRSDGVRITTPDGRLAGSAAGIDAGPRTLVAEGIPPGEALAAACEAPRRLLGLPPGFTVGGPADLVVLDGHLVPRLTLVGGRVAHASADLPFRVPPAGRPICDQAGDP